MGPAHRGSTCRHRKIRTISQVLERWWNFICYEWHLLLGLLFVQYVYKGGIWKIARKSFLTKI